MRITGNRLIENSSEATMRQQSRVGTAADQVTSGLRVAKPSDDPGAWLTAQRSKVHKVLSEGIGAAVAAGRDRLDEVDGALGAIGDMVAQVRTLAIQGSSATLNANDRTELAEQVRGLYAVALGAANRKSVDGEYLLAGTNSRVQPFDAAGVYAGDGSERQVALTEDSTSSSTVAGVALTAAHGPGSVDVLPLMDRVATALANNDTTTLASMLPDLVTAVAQVAQARTRVGSEMNVLDATSQAHAALRQNLDQVISRSVEADSVAAASDLAKASQALDVSRAVSAHIVSMLSKA
jgi:flagellar hook-associated protein 3 FlgL